MTRDDLMVRLRELADAYADPRRHSVDRAEMRAATARLADALAQCPGVIGIAQILTGEARGGSK